MDLKQALWIIYNENYPKFEMAIKTIYEDQTGIKLGDEYNLKEIIEYMGVNFEVNCIENSDFKSKIIRNKNGEYTIIFNSNSYETLKKNNVLNQELGKHFGLVCLYHKNWDKFIDEVVVDQDITNSKQLTKKPKKNAGASNKKDFF